MITMNEIIKINVFISSHCSSTEKDYLVARRSLKELLLSTGLVEHVYLFEDSPAMSCGVQDAYLDAIEKSDVVIFLINNKDDVRDPVKNESLYANSLRKRCLYIFCDEGNCEPTIIQKTIEKQQFEGAKYSIVHDFREVVTGAYYSFINDIIALYIKKPTTVSSQKTVLGRKEYESETVSYFNYSYEIILPRKDIESFGSIANLFVGYSSEMGKTVDDNNLLEGLRIQLETCICRKGFSDDEFENYRYAVLALFSDKMSELISFRLEALRLYYWGEYEKCLHKLQECLLLANKNKCSSWIILDIAIDIRFIHNLVLETSKTSVVENEGQRIINENKDYVYYPVLDRCIEELYKKLAEEYYSNSHLSPFSIEYKNYNNLFENLAISFGFASCFGSIVQTRITVDRLIDIYKCLTSVLSNKDLFIELQRLLFIRGDRKSIEAFLNKYHFAETVVTSSDAVSLFNSLKMIKSVFHRNRALFLMATFMGAYLDDDSFEEIRKELFSIVEIWIENEKHDIYLAELILCFFKQMVMRINNNDIISFIIRMKSLVAFGAMIVIFETLSRIKYDDCKDEIVEQVVDFICSQIVTGSSYLGLAAFRNAVIIISRSVKDATRIKDCLRNHCFDFYSDIYSINVNDSEEELRRLFELYLEKIDEWNRSEGSSGSYRLGIVSPYEMIRYIISKNTSIFNETDILRLCNECKSGFEKDNHSIETKRTICKLLQYLKEVYPSNALGCLLVDLQKNTSAYLQAKQFFNENDKNEYLLLDYYLMIYDSTHNNCSDAIADVLFSNTNDEYSQIQFLDSIAYYLSFKKKEIDSSLVSTFLQYSIVCSSSEQLHVSFHSVRCLLLLLDYVNDSSLILSHLLKAMAFGKTDVRCLIINELKKRETKANSLEEMVISKGKADCNYFVRKLASDVRKIE